MNAYFKKLKIYIYFLNSILNLFEDAIFLEALNEPRKRIYNKL